VAGQKKNVEEMLGEKEQSKKRGGRVREQAGRKAY